MYPSNFSINLGLFASLSGPSDLDIYLDEITEVCSINLIEQNFWCSWISSCKGIFPLPFPLLWRCCTWSFYLFSSLCYTCHFCLRFFPSWNCPSEIESRTNRKKLCLESRWVTSWLWISRCLNLDQSMPEFGQSMLESRVGFAWIHIRDKR